MHFSARGLLRTTGRLLCLAIASCSPTFAQPASTPAPAANQAELAARIATLNQTVEETRAELSKSRSEIQQLWGMLEQVLRKMGEADAGVSGAAARREQATEESPGNSQKAKPGDQQNLARSTGDDWQIANTRLTGGKYFVHGINL
jgi:hypothetical protein